MDHCTTLPTARLLPHRLGCGNLWYTLGAGPIRSDRHQRSDQGHPSPCLPKPKKFEDTAIPILRRSLLASGCLGVPANQSFLAGNVYWDERMFIDRRRVLGILAGSMFTPAFAQAPAMTRITAYVFSFAGLEGADIKLAEHAGRPILVVNTASLCGYTPQ
jgi:hypothetical protein